MADLQGSLGLIGNDTMSSIDVANGWQATICTDDLLVGCTDLGPGVHNTLPAGFDNAVSFAPNHAEGRRQSSTGGRRDGHPHEWHRTTHCAVQRGRLERP